MAHELGRLQVLPADDAREHEADGAAERALPRLDVSAAERAVPTPGAPLPQRTRLGMERALGADFSSVRIHADAAAGERAESVGAQAYARGRDLHFRPEAFAPWTRPGARLLAHELAHAAQQGAAPAPPGRFTGAPTGALQREVLPEDVRRALLRGRSAAGAQARREALAATQETTVGHAGGATLPERPLERQDRTAFLVMPEAQQALWAVRRLGAFQAQLYESAMANAIPMQLLSTIILNELTDISMPDLIQMSVHAAQGSLGISQMQVSTALERGHLPGLTGASNVDWVQAAALLRVPQWAIYAAAREIADLLREMGANRSSPWQLRHGFVATGPVGSAIYAYLDGRNMVARESNLAHMVAAAYNSPNIVTAQDTSRFPNAISNGESASVVAGILYDHDLFRARPADVIAPDAIERDTATA